MSPPEPSCARLAISRGVAKCLAAVKTVAPKEGKKSEYDFLCFILLNVVDAWQKMKEKKSQPLFRTYSACLKLHPLEIAIAVVSPVLAHLKVLCGFCKDRSGSL